MVDADQKFSLGCMQNFYPNMSWIINGNQKPFSFDQGVLSWINILQNKNAVNIQMHFGNQERLYIPVSLGIADYKVFGKTQLALRSAQFTTVPNHDSWEALTEDNA